MSGDLIDAFRAEAPADKQALITALFEKITLWDLSVSSARVEPTDDGRFRVTMSIATQQFEADGAGKETEVPLDMWLDVGVFGESAGRSRRKRSAGAAADRKAPLRQRNVDARVRRRSAAGACRHRSVQQDDRPQSRRQSEASRQVSSPRFERPQRDRGRLLDEDAAADALKMFAEWTAVPSPAADDVGVGARAVAVVPVFRRQHAEVQRAAAQRARFAIAARHARRRATATRRGKPRGRTARARRSRSPTRASNRSLRHRCSLYSTPVQRAFGNSFCNASQHPAQAATDVEHATHRQLEVPQIGRDESGLRRTACGVVARVRGLR